MDKVVTKEAKPDVVAEASRHVEHMSLMMDAIGQMLGRVMASTERGIQKQNARLTEGKAVGLNFEALSVYVDNSQGTTELDLIDEGGIHFTIAAGAQSWVHPMGCSQFEVSGGDGNIPAMFVNRFLSI